MIIHRRREATPVDAAGLRRGQTIAGYRIDRVLGTGGMGAVYQATQLSLDRKVALKVIAPGLQLDGPLRERFRREGRVQALIDHPHILPVYEAGESHGRLFIAMRLVHGRTLKALIVARALDRGRSMRILGDVAHALDTAHAAGLVHRDVKPQNILIDRGDFAYLADFGLTRAPSDETLTHAGQLLGSIAYMSPEQVRGERATAASDLYSFGCVVYECLVGLVPFPRDSDQAVLHAHVWEPPPRASEIRPELPPALDDVLARSMAKAPEARQETALAIIRAARSALGLEADADDDEPAAYAFDVGAASTVDPGSWSSGQRAPRPRRAWAALLGMLALLIGLAGGYAVAHDSGTSTARGATTVDQRPVSVANTRFETDLNAAFGALSARKAADERKLARATTVTGQASALASLERAYRAAGAAVAGARTPTRAKQARAAIGVGLVRLADSYRSLELAARRRSRRAYAAAKLALRRRQAALTDALRRLHRLGFRLT